MAMKSGQASPHGAEARRRDQKSNLRVDIVGAKNMGNQEEVRSNAMTS